MENETKTVYEREMYAIYDNKANTFTAPFIAGTQEESKRIFGDMCYFGGDNLIARHPNDYSLYLVGYYNINTGSVTPLSKLPEFVINAHDIIEIYKSKYKKLTVDSEEVNELTENNLISA